MTGTCTRCGEKGPIALAGTIECSPHEVPFKFCASCYAYYRLLDDDEKAEFAISLWMKGAVLA